MSGAILLTGATGFLGMDALARLIEREGEQIVVLVRARDDDEARERLETVLARLYDEPPAAAAQVRAVRGDLLQPGLGLSVKDRERLIGSVDRIIHCAASISFELPLAEARETNVEGVARVIELARGIAAEGSLRRLVHVSTAYVSGRHAGEFGEEDLDVGQEFRNTYERSKNEAEHLLRGALDLPLVVARPSIVVGHQASGWTPVFNVLYWPLRAFARGLFTAVPAIPTAPVDVVSVDYVADAVHALCESEGGIGETYHLTAGAGASTMGEIAQLASRYFRRPLPRVLSPAEFAALEGGSVERSALDASRIYFPYFAIDTVFDQAATQARLEPQGIRVTPLRDYLERLLDFATRSRWGKRPIARVDAVPT